MTTTALRSSRSNDSAADLCRHLQQCHRARGRWFGAAMLAERVHSLVAPRFATTVGGVAILLTLASLFL